MGYPYFRKPPCIFLHNSSMLSGNLQYMRYSTSAAMSCFQHVIGRISCIQKHQTHLPHIQGLQSKGELALEAIHLDSVAGIFKVLDHEKTHVAKPQQLAHRNILKPKPLKLNLFSYFSWNIACFCQWDFCPPEIVGRSVASLAGTRPSALSWPRIARMGEMSEQDSVPVVQSSIQWVTENIVRMDWMDDTLNA